MSLGLARALPLGRKRIKIRSIKLSQLFSSALLIASILSLLYLSQTSTVATTGYNIKRLEEEKAQWELRNEQLRFKVAQLQSLDRIEKEAATRLKLAPSTKLIFVTADVAPGSNLNRGQTYTSAREREAPAEKGTGLWEELLNLLHL